MELYKNIKEGDFLLCKKSYFDDPEKASDIFEVFKENEKYEVIEVTNNYTEMRGENGKYYVFSNLSINNFFCTKQEERKIKLERLK